MTSVSVRIERLPHGQDVPLPEVKSSGAAGFDLHAALPENSPLVLEPGDRVLVPTGLKMAIPLGYEGQVRPRSGLALKSGITVLNAPGTIDSDFRGEVSVLLINLGKDAFSIWRMARIAQIVFVKLPNVQLVDGDVGATLRGEGGFGSTGS